MANTTAQRGKTRHHENQMVHDAVEHYAEAVYARTDLSDEQKEETIQKYQQRMRDLWDSPERGKK